MQIYSYRAKIIASIGHPGLERLRLGTAGDSQPLPTSVSLDGLDWCGREFVLPRLATQISRAELLFWQHLTDCAINAVSRFLLAQLHGGRIDDSVVQLDGFIPAAHCVAR